MHWDSTTRSFSGEYKDGEPDAVKVTYDHSKDHRPDLKQIVLSLLANRQGMPLWGRVEDGNASDKRLNGETLEQIRQAFSADQLRSMTYVADSAFATQQNFELGREISLGFLTRLPETFSATAQAKEQARQDAAFEDVGRVAVRRKAAHYRASEQAHQIGGVPYGLVVYHYLELGASGNPNGESYGWGYHASGRAKGVRYGYGAEGECIYREIQDGTYTDPETFPREKERLAEAWRLRERARQWAREAERATQERARQAEAEAASQRERDEWLSLGGRP